MSFRELRNFCEIMRGLGYPRLISLENFRKPNFELVADILYWLALRYDPNANISDNIDEERDRVEFIKSIAMLFETKARIKLNMKKLYRSDGHAVQELLKIGTMLYKAYNSSGHDEEESVEFALPSKFSNLKSVKNIVGEITEVGTKVYDLLGKENELKLHREKAINFLENISRNLDSNNEQQYIEKCVREIIAQQTTTIQQLKQYVDNLSKDERTLEEKIKKRTIDYDRAEKRLRDLSNVKPAYMEEYERLERELERLYSIYIDYLENQMDMYNQEDHLKFEEAQKARQKIQKQIKEAEMRELRGDEEINEALLDAQLKEENFGDSRGQSRSSSRGGNKLKKHDKDKMGMRDAFGNKNFGKGKDESEEEDGDDDGEEEEESDDNVKKNVSDSDNEF